jgi:hypothetical protein
MAKGLLQHSSRGISSWSPFFFRTGKSHHFFTHRVPPPPRAVEAFFLCPVFAPKDQNMPFARSGDRVPIYAYNTMGVADYDHHFGLGWYISTLGRNCIRESAVVSPAQMIALADPFARSLVSAQDALFRPDISWKPHRTSTPVAPGQISKSQNAVKLHGYKFNRVFGDAHVEEENFKNSFNAGDDYLRQWNTDNEAHRELWE